MENFSVEKYTPTLLFAFHDNKWYSYLSWHGWYVDVELCLCIWRVFHGNERDFRTGEYEAHFFTSDPLWVGEDGVCAYVCACVCVSVVTPVRRVCQADTGSIWKWHTYLWPSLNNVCAAGSDEAAYYIPTVLSDASVMASRSLSWSDLSLNLYPSLISRCIPLFIPWAEQLLGIWLFSNNVARINYFSWKEFKAF